MKVLIDGDSCGITRKIVNKSIRNGYDVHIYCDFNHFQDYSGAKTHYVGQGRDAADWAILNVVSAGDTVFTADAGLASMCIVRGATVKDFRGHEFTEQDLNAALIGRYIRSNIKKRSRKGNGYNRRVSRTVACF